MTTLSIVSGTYNRLPYLRLMVASARQQLPHGLSYEFILIDGGSTDGTLDWARQQADVRLIEDGQLTGAISAFSRAARTSQADYVLLANDDVVFQPFSILAALSHLETHPGCAAVAFADNRTSLVTGDGKDYRTEGIGATLPNGQPTMVTYAQVGLFRRALAEAAGWWGDLDPIMGQARTYGGDCYLSARLWEAGYTVEPADGAVIDDLIVRDGLRSAHSSGLNGFDSARYYERFPTVHLPGEGRKVDAPDRLRILYLPIYEAGHVQAANRESWMLEALSAHGLCLEVDYLNTDTDLPALVRAWQPDLILTQIQGIGPKLDAHVLSAMRAACPTALVVNFNGDAHMEGLTGPAMLDLLRHVDLQTTVNAAALPVYEREGIAAAYWQIAYRAPLTPWPDVPRYDVLAQMNWYAYREPLFELLYGLPCNVGVFGNDRRATGNTHYDFAAQAALYASATITVGDTFPFQTRAFVSNRVFQALYAGAFLLQQHSEALEEFTGLVAGVHYAEWTDVEDLRAKVAYWLQPEQAEARAQIARAGQAFVRERFSCEAQVRKLFTDLLPKVRAHEPELA